MSNIPFSDRFVRVSVIAAVFIAGSVAPGYAYVIDRYGNSHVTLQDMGDASFAQSQASAAAYNERAKRNSGSVNAGAANQGVNWEAYRKELRQTIYEANVAAHARNEAYIQQCVWERKAREAAIEAARKADIEAGERVRLGFIEKFANEQKRIASVILNAGREKVSPTRDAYINENVVVGFAEGLLTGSFRGQSLADLQVTLTPAERFATALKLYGDFNFYGEHYGHRENHHLQNGSSPAAFHTDLIGPAALSFGGHGDYVLRNTLDNIYIAEPNAGLTIAAALAAALVMPESDLDAAQRQQSLSLLAHVMPRLKLAGHDGTALAALLVAAAQKNPELAAVKAVQDQFLPLVRESVWAHGFQSMQLPATDRTFTALPSVDPSYWNLASMVTLARASDAPMLWFVRIRQFRRQSNLRPANAGEKAVVQQALRDWFVRSGASPGIRRAVQNDCDLACDAPVAELASSEKWDGFVAWIYTNTLPELDNRTTSLKELLEGKSLGQPGANSFLALSTAWLALPRHLLEESYADLPDRASRSLTALRHLTDIDDAFSFYAIPKSSWETLVNLGEGYRQTKVQSWLEPEVSARLARIRSERLDDEDGALRALADPTRQPKATDSEEKWQSWARLGGRAGLIVALQRHPEFFSDSVLLRERLNEIADDHPGPEALVALKNLLGLCGDVIDPATVLAIAQIRGPMLGDWAKLGTWLDDPRRRPKDDQDPLHNIFVAAILERDMVAGSLTSIPFGPRADAESCQQFHDWLVDVLAATGVERKKLIDDHFPAIIYCPEAASAYPDLRMIGYDIEQGGFASRALLLLSSQEFNPEWLILNGYAVIDGDDGKPERIGGPDLEPWLEAVAKLPRTVTPEVLLAEISASVKVRRDYLTAKVAALATPPPETAPRELTEEEASALILKEEREDNDRRTRWVADGCQDALVRLANRWSPARVPAQAAVLALGDQFLLDDEGIEKTNPACIATRVAWEQAKMKGMDDASAFAAATAALPREELKTLATLAKIETRTQPLLLRHDEHFAREAVAAVASRP